MATRRRQKPARRKVRPTPLFIEEWMGHLGLDDKEVANRLGVARETVTRYRGQQHRLNAEKIARLAFALQIGPMDLWRHPSQTSVDSLLRDAPDDMRRRVVGMVEAFIKPTQ